MGQLCAQRVPEEPRSPRDVQPLNPDIGPDINEAQANIQAPPALEAQQVHEDHLIRDRPSGEKSWVCLAALWVGVAVIGACGAALGDLQGLKTGRDVYGNSCGQGEMREWRLVYFPDPVEALELTLCVTSCPLESISEYIALYNSDVVTSDEVIRYDSYPSRPLYGSYCLPAAAYLRFPIQSKLFSHESSYTFILSDVIEGKEALGIAAGVTIFIISLVLWLFHYEMWRKVVYAVSNLLLIAEIGCLSYGLYEEPERQEADICSDYQSVHMQDCSRPKEDYRVLFWTCIGVFWAILIVATQLSKQKKDYFKRFDQMKSVSSRGILPIVVALFLGSIVFIILLLCILAISSIGSLSSHDTGTNFEFPVKTWGYVQAIRYVFTVYGVITGLWTLSWISHGVLLFTSMEATGTSWSNTQQNCSVIAAKLVWASLKIPFFRVLHTVPAVLHSYWVADSSPEKPTGDLPVLSTPFAFVFPTNEQSHVIFPWFRQIKPEQWRDAKRVELLLWTLELSVILLGPALVYTSLRTMEIAVSSYVVLEVVILPYSYFLSQLLGNCLRGLIYPVDSISDSEPPDDRKVSPIPLQVGLEVQGL